MVNCVFFSTIFYQKSLKKTNISSICCQKSLKGHFSKLSGKIAQSKQFSAPNSRKQKSQVSGHFFLNSVLVLLRGDTLNCQRNLRVEVEMPLITKISKYKLFKLIASFLFQEGRVIGRKTKRTRTQWWYARRFDPADDGDTPIFCYLLTVGYKVL